MTSTSSSSSSSSAPSTSFIPSSESKQSESNSSPSSSSSPSTSLCPSPSTSSFPFTPNSIFLFDVDGTLTPPRLVVSDTMLEFLKYLRGKCLIGIVGGSDLSKQKEQLGPSVIQNFDFIFSENGLVSYHLGKEIHRQSIVTHLGEDKLQRFINFVLHYLSQLTLPVKRGTFIEFRSGMLNVSPIGRNCSQREREEFEIYDQQNHIRSKMVETLQKEFSSYNLKFSIGGQISFDVFPIGWDKTYCLQFLRQNHISDIHFFGDKTAEGGNDYEIYSHKEVNGYNTKGPNHTIEQIKLILKEKNVKGQEEESQEKK